MSAHDHREYVPGCYRCELSRDEAVETAEDLLLEVTAADLHPWDDGHHRASILTALNHPSELLAALVEEHGRDKVLGWLGGERFGSYGPVDGVPVEECWAFPGKEGADHE